MARLREAVPTDLNAITALCFRSKAHWGYDDAFMEACRDDLRLSETDLEEHLVRVIEDEGTLVAVGMLTIRDGEAEADKLFIDPIAMGRGLGRMLMNWMIEEARAEGAKQIRIASDPQAAPFYERCGATIVGRTPSGSIPGRFLPLLALPI